MDPRLCLIVDLEQRGNKQMFITEQVASISRENNYWLVRFINSPRIFKYNLARLLYFTQAETIELGEKGLYVHKKRTDATEILCFSDNRYTFYRITYPNGYVRYLEPQDIYITRTPINNNGGSVWDYLRTLADETGLLVGEDKNILSRQYNLVDLKRDNVPLAQYIGHKRKLSSNKLPSQVYYPFGCNASQKKAVERALTNQVSIIQGPPGTGKTQTILNIVANLLMQQKTILVVSSNNSAVENVAEKLHREGLGFLVAQLGNTENKQAFIKQQSENYPDMSSWIIQDISTIKHLAQQSLQTVSHSFDKQTKLAKLDLEYEELSTEYIYNEQLNNPILTDIDWLYNKPSKQLMYLLNICQMMMEKRIKPSFWFRIKWALHLGRRAYSLLGNKIALVVSSLEHAVYKTRLDEIKKEQEEIKEQLQTIDLEQNIKNLTSSSLQLLKNKIAKVYTSNSRPKFTTIDITLQSERFLDEYPVVLSTTYSAKSCISPDMIFDYVIMDEASQVDIKTGALALSCAQNIVIVGDDKQLPNVITREENIALMALLSSFQIDECYNAATHSFLLSCSKVFKEAPTTLLREHYRCHPKIISFCNKRFYEGNLLAMTTDHGEQDVLCVIRTVKGNHARGHLNQREIDVIVQEIIPELSSEEASIGIITPYREQAEAINALLKKDIASTVHKYQGRECDTIIMSMVDNVPTQFSDNINLLNVAISRAKRKLYIVTSGNDIPENTNLAQLISYIRYNNFEVKGSKLRSVFDFLYKQYAAERLAYQAEHEGGVSEHLSENLVYDTIIEAINTLEQSNLSVVCHYPLAKLIMDWTLLDEQEQSFAQSPFAHVDFLIYNTLSKKPLLPIEVDGWYFHQDKVVQRERDALKDNILAKYDLTPHRISTVEIVNKDTMVRLLEEFLNEGL